MWLRFLFWSFAEHFFYIKLINQRKAMREKGEDNVLQVGAMVSRDDQMVRIRRVEQGSRAAEEETRQPDTDLAGSVKTGAGC
jgi:hypothetical protein